MIEPEGNPFEKLPLLGPEKATDKKKSKESDLINQVFDSFENLQDKTSLFLLDVNWSVDKRTTPDEKELYIGSAVKAYPAFKSALDNFTKKLDLILEKNKPLGKRLEVFTERLVWLKNASKGLDLLGSLNVQNAAIACMYSNIVKENIGLVTKEIAGKPYISSKEKLIDIWKEKSRESGETSDSEEDELPPSSSINTKYTYRDRGEEEDYKFRNDAEYWKTKKNK